MDYKKYKKSVLIKMLNIKDKTIEFLSKNQVDEEIKGTIGSLNEFLYFTDKFEMDWYRSIVKRTMPLFSVKRNEFVEHYRVFKDGNIVQVLIDQTQKKPIHVAFYKRAK